MINEHDIADMSPGTPRAIQRPTMWKDVDEMKKAHVGKVSQGGMKFDNEKPRMDLVDPEFIEGLAEVLTFGARKYAAHNWRSGIAFSRLIAAAYRHLGAINKGEDIDPESGKPHSYHLGCCVQFLSWMMKHRPDLDDRYKG